MFDELHNTNQLSIRLLANSIVVIFTNPQERNPLSVKILLALDSLFDKLENETSIEKIIFTGTENVFASGANLREVLQVTNKTARQYALRGQNLMNKISGSRLLTIAAVNGYCFGGAFDLCLACRIRIASPNALFCHPGANLGIMTGWGGTQRLPRLIGESAALEAFLTAKQIPANEALKIKLIDEIDENPLARALQR